MPFYENFLPISYHGRTMLRKLPVNATSGVHFIYPKMRVWVTVKEEEKSYH